MNDLMAIDFIEWRDRMIVGLADRMPHEGGVTVSGKELAHSLGLLVSLSWIDALRRELSDKKWAYIDWDMDDPEDVGFELYGNGLLEAAKIRRAMAKPSVSQKIDGWNWQKWSFVIAAIALVLYVIVEMF